MIPERTSCPTSWTREYQVIMSARFNHQRSSFVCVNETLEVIPTTSGTSNGAPFHLTNVMCNGIKCPPYRGGDELTCAVYTI